MERTHSLKDGTEVILRELRASDLDDLMKFYRSLSPEDRKYLKFNVLDRSVVAKRLERLAAGQDFRVAAFVRGKIVASGALELAGEGWVRHRGEIRVIVAPRLQHKGLGTLIIRELYFVALEQKLESVTAWMMRPQVGAQHIFRKFGFREESLLPDFVKDLEGEAQDLIVMTCSLKDLARELGHTFGDDDWERCR
ncbi:MAG: GNAT family N-acetyltransferase [Candidatus Aminicenantes bacterium]|nr:GNAT family N-acetyltransferase [Candidatus Aminicenantes bacterium]